MFLSKVRSTFGKLMGAKVLVRSKIRVSFLINVMDHYKPHAALYENILTHFLLPQVVKDSFRLQINWQHSPMSHVPDNI